MTRRRIIAAMMAASGVLLTSCSDTQAISGLVDEQPAGKGHVRLVCSMAMGVTTRADLTANGKALTDLYIMDYDKQTGKLLQVLHQTSTAQDFAEPDLTLDYGDHTLKVVATRSTSPTLQTAEGVAWALTADVLTAAPTSDVPVVLASSKTSDTFGAQQDVTVGVGSAASVSITLERLVANLMVKTTDAFPSDATTLDIELDEHTGFSFKDFSVIEALKNHRITDVSALAGQIGTTLSYYFLCPADGYITDITFTANISTGTPYTAITVEDVPLERNKVTTVTGSIYGHQQGTVVTVNDTWDATGHDVTF